MSGARRPVAGAVRGQVRVGLVGASLPGEEAQDVEAGSDADAVAWIEEQTAVVRGGDGVARTARLGPARRTEAGAVRVEVLVDGWRFELEAEDAGRAALRRRATRSAEADPTSGPADIRAIIPGRVAAVRVTAGDTVAVGQTLLVVEAMKMQNELRAPRGGTVEHVAVAEGQTIDAGDLLVVLR